MSSDGVLTWAIPSIPPSGPIDPQWYNAYKFLLKFTDDGAGGGGSRSKTVAIFQSPEVDVDFSGAWQLPPDAIKDTPIAVDDFLVTPVDTFLQANVIGENYNPTIRGGDYLDNGSAPATFELVGGGPAHAASFILNTVTGAFSYLPVEGYEGLDTFTYRIDAPEAWYTYNSGTGYTYSAHNYSNTATVTIQVGKGVRAHLDAEGLVDDLLLIGLSDDYDDVNENGLVDLDERAGPPTGEADLVAVDLSYWLRDDGYAPDFIAWLSVGDDQMIRLWDSPSKDNEIIPFSGDHVGNHWLLEDIPSTVWMEAVSAGSTWLTLEIGGQDTSMFTNMVYAGAQTPADFRTMNVTAANFNLTGYRPQTEAYGSPFARTAIPFEKEEDPGVYIRRNGDDDDHNFTADRQDIPGPVPGENDLIEVVLSRANVAGVRYILERTNANVNVWTSSTKGTALQFTNNEAVITFGAATSMTLWVEWTNMAAGATTSSLFSYIEDARFPQGSEHDRLIDQLDFHPFNSVVIVLGGRTQQPSDPTIPDYGTFQTAIDLYREAYDVHMYNENAVSADLTNNGSGLPYDEVVSAIQKRGVTQVAIFGYSYGGGATHNLSWRLNEWRQQIGQFEIKFTGYIDAVVQNSLGSEETRPPPGSKWHLNIYQPNGQFQLGGGTMPKPDSDLEYNAEDWGPKLDDHYYIDDDFRTLRRTRVHLKLHTSR